MGLRCCTQAFSSCGEQGLLFSLRCTGFSLQWLLLLQAWAVGMRASVVVARGLSSCGSWALECRLSSCGAWAYLLPGTWDLPGPGLEPMSPALAGGFLITVPPGKPRAHFPGAFSSHLWPWGGPKLGESPHQDRKEKQKDMEWLGTSLGHWTKFAWNQHYLWTWQLLVPTNSLHCFNHF